jgi:hypothetical protein
MCFYDDEVKVFIEYELNKIDYFRQLSPQTKHDIIFSMEKKQYNEGEIMCKRG